MYTKMAYRQSGEGPVLILVHGYAGSVHHWKEVIPTLEGRFTVVVPNCTHLYMSKEPLTFADQIEEFADFIRENFPNRTVSLAGASYGGAIVWGLALTHSDLVDKVVFVNPMPPGPVDYIAIPTIRSFFKFPLTARGTYLFLKTPVGKYFLKKSAFIFRDERAESDDWIKHLTGRKLSFVTHIIYKFAWILKSESWRPWQARLGFWTHDALCIYDGEDPLFYKEAYQDFIEKISCRHVQIINGAGHIAIAHRGTEIADQMLRFFEGPKSKH